MSTKLMKPVSPILSFALVIYSLSFCLLSFSAASAQQIVDTAGFVWDLSPNATVDDGSNDTFDVAMGLYLNDAMYSGAGSPNEKGELYTYGECQVAGVKTTRHILEIKDPAGIFYTETFENDTQNEKKLKAYISSYFGDSALPRAKVTADGMMTALLYPHPEPRCAVIYHFGPKNAKVLPTLSGSGDVYNFEYPEFTLHPGQKKSIGYFVAQRPLANSTDLFDDQTVFKNCIAQMSAIGNFSYVNLPGMSLYDVGAVSLTAQGRSEFIETKTGDQVFGDILTEEIVLETEIGKRAFRASDVINLVSVEQDKFCVVATDGSVLTGRLVTDSLEFRLSDGSVGEIATDKLVTLSMRRLDQGVKRQHSHRWFKFSDPVFVFAGGDRLSGKVSNKNLQVTTAIGKYEVPIDSLSSIQFDHSMGTGFNAQFRLKSGQVFSGIVESEFEYQSWDGEVRKAAAGNLLSVFFEDQTQEQLFQLNSYLNSYIELGDGEFVYAKVLNDQQPLEFETSFGVRKIDPARIKQLTVTPGLTDKMEVILWDDSKLNGALTSPTIRFEMFGQAVDVAITRFRVFKNPLADPPQEIRDQYLKLIAQLNDKKYAKRRGAARSLKADAKKIRGLLLAQFESADVETKAQIWKILPPSDQKRLKNPKPSSKKKLKEGDEPKENATEQQDGQNADVDPDAENNNDDGGMDR